MSSPAGGVAGTGATAAAHLGLAPVDAPFPVERVHRVVPAPRPLNGEPSVVLDDAWPAALHRRLDRLRHDRAGVVVGGTRRQVLRAAWRLLPVGWDGEVALLPHLAVAVDVAHGTAEPTGPPVTGQAELLAESGDDLLLVGWLLACSDDLVVLRRTGPGALAAELLAVAFPSGWPPRQRLGASLDDLHAPVADGERLRRASPALSEALLAKGPYLQHVWGLDPSGRLDRDPSAPDADTTPRPPPDQWWLRVERQTSLPLGDRALFTIRPFLTPLTALTSEQRAVLASAVRSMSPASRAYKGVPNGLEDWLVS